MTQHILKENFEVALNIAIKKLEEDEHLKESGLAQGLRDVLAASLRGEMVSVEQSIPPVYVEYEEIPYNRAEHVIKKDSIDYWLTMNLKRGGIEDQIRKMRALISIIGEQWIINNPDRINGVAFEIGCAGYNHRVVNE